jgi:hypothetical protein
VELQVLDLEDKELVLVNSQFSHINLVLDLDHNLEEVHQRFELEVLMMIKKMIKMMINREKSKNNRETLLTKKIKMVK